MNVSDFLKKLLLNFSLPLSSYLAGLPVSLDGSVSLGKIVNFLKKAPFLKSFFRSPDCSDPKNCQKKSRESLILDFWRAVEYFSVQQIPEETPPLKYATSRPIEQVFTYHPEESLPWDESHWICQYLKKAGLYYTYPPVGSPPHDPTNQLAKKEGNFLRFKVFGGVYSTRLIRQTLEDKCGKDEGYDDDLGASEKLKEGDTCAYFFNVTDDGRPLFDSFVLPTCAWALGRSLNPGPHHPDWFNDFDEFEAQAKQNFQQHFAIEDDDAIGQELKPFNVGRVITDERLVAYTQKMMDDLGLGGIVKYPGIRLESVLRRYNAKLPENGRYEVTDTEFLNSFFIDDLTKISKILNEGEGHAPRCGLGLAKFLTSEQDVDIKRRIDVRRNRPHVLQSLAPSKFPAGCWPTKGDHPLATSQQFAINEIQELNHETGILAVNGPPGTGKTTLLRDLISSVVVERAKAISLLKKPSNAFKGTDSWKATTGYARKIFLWKPEFTGFEIVVTSSNNGAIENVTLEIPGREAIDPSWLPKINYFTELAELLLGQPAWGLVGARLGSKRNCSAFQTAFWYGKVPYGRKPSTSQSVTPDLFTGHRNQPDGAPFGGAQPSSNPKKGLKDILESLTAQSVDWEAAVAQFNEALAFEKEKRTEAEKIYALFEKATRLQEKPKWVPDVAANWQWAQFLMNWLYKKRLEKLQRRLSQKAEGVSLAQWAQDEDSQELSIPWLTSPWFQARAKVFLEALKLHRSFITANAKIMQQNLWGAMDILQDTVPLDTSPAAIASAWSSLFFVVPVLSTTFASFSRLFSHIGQEGLGWLLIDEAGQALPQAAVGAIWRARRTVVVGDPMQLKPVIPLSLSAQTTLQRHYQTEATWLPGRTSVQELADRVCPMGTIIKSNNTPKWVGMPLRVHRRCEKPEFNLSNIISYDGLMIFGTPNRPSMTLPKSRWVDISETIGNQGHWIPEEGTFTRRLIEKLIQEGTSPQSIFVISPFRAVVNGLEVELKNFRKRVNIGTIHTTQGREADVVILVLGGNPEKPGAKKWASQEPNLLNVAVTRAKRRFYIIGNHNEWSQYPYFRDASDLFKPPPPSDGNWEAYEKEFMALLA